MAGSKGAGGNDVPNTPATDDPRLLMLRPAVRLANGRRYIVALRRIVDEGGHTIAPSPVFRALRDGHALEGGTEAERWSVFARRDMYADIFGKLERAGVAKSELQMAWDYTTATRENIAGPALAMRDQALAMVGVAGPEFTVKQVTEYPDATENPHLLRRIELVMTVPLFLTGASDEHSTDQALDRLNIDERGELAPNGTMAVDVLVLVPQRPRGWIRPWSAAGWTRVCSAHDSRGANVVARGRRDPVGALGSVARKERGRTRSRWQRGHHLHRMMPHAAATCW